MSASRLAEGSFAARLRAVHDPVIRSIPPAPSNGPGGFVPEAKWQELRTILRLSPRELEITRCIVEDMSEEAIAACLGISTHTVHSYIDRLYRKLSLRSRCHLVALVFRTYIAHSEPAVEAPCLRAPHAVRR